MCHLLNKNTLNLNQYLPFPLTHSLSPNHSLTPSVGQNDILAYSVLDTFKILSQSDLASCHKMGEPIFARGGIFPDLEPQQFLQAMQSLNDYGLHIVDAAVIAHHLKFENFNDPTPT